MEKKNDFDFLKSRFDADGLEAPESLSAEEMKKRILEAESAGTNDAEHTASPAGIKQD